MKKVLHSNMLIYDSLDMSRFSIIYPNTPDDVLCNEFIKGNYRAEEELFRRFSKAISSKLKSRLRQLNRSSYFDDFRNDLFIILVTNIKRGDFNANPGNLGGYAYKIYFNQFKRLVNKYRLFDKTVIYVADSRKMEFLDYIKKVKEEDDEFKEKLQRAMLLLPAKYIMIFNLIIHHRKKYLEIAEELGIPLGTVKTRVHIGREIIRKNLIEINEKEKNESDKRRFINRVP